MTHHNTERNTEHDDAASRGGGTPSSEPGQLDLVWTPRDEGLDERARRSLRRSVVVAAVTAMFLLLMVAIGTYWSFLLSAGAVVAVCYWDRHLRPDPPEVPLLAYIAGMILGGLVVLACAGLLLLLAALVLP